MARVFIVIVDVKTNPTWKKPRNLWMRKVAIVPVSRKKR